MGRPWFVVKPVDAVMSDMAYFTYVSRYASRFGLQLLPHSGFELMKSQKLILYFFFYNFVPCPTELAEGKRKLLIVAPLAARVLAKDDEYWRGKEKETAKEAIIITILWYLKEQCS